MTSSPINVAIIGAGLSGLSLALALHQQNIPCTLYERNNAPLNIGGAVMLSPNALKVLDALSVYSRIRTKGYNFETLEYKNGDGKLLEVYEFGSEEKYGYKALRIYRKVLIEELVEMLREKGVQIVFGKKFVKVLEESEESVSWEFADGTVGKASLLVGADGIHSTVRKYLYPDLKPTFAGGMGVTAAVPTEQLKLPPGYHIPVTILTPHGSFVIAPQQVDGSEVLIGKQKRVPKDHDRAGWDAISADKEALVKFLQQDTEHFPEFVRNAVSKIGHGKINVWPYYIVPKIERWTSDKRRIVILGDSAHAIPPSAGQGINQAFEDIYIFALLLGQVNKVDTQDALKFWQEYREQRIAKVMDLNNQIELRRMTKEEREKMPAGSMHEIELSWLYKPNFKEDVDKWVATKSKVAA
ncbi:FAD/NAD(P)-binding domain-containing protein [Hyaloscypha variabilis F]|uniref:FAD/NAD(P)-binding domain-containing protein n=1 Tax=Hyaloscypha variabilis (strain UAMH 11265 / GT02V1 / F) TaxID=1149755 RepID=A0A2J6QZ22_HYAVF|nr:FAD/NAD(P)-binding domain-containing protein [Hyaloscypha variabilis F]